MPTAAWPGSQGGPPGVTLMERNPGGEMAVCYGNPPLSPKRPTESFFSLQKPPQPRHPPSHGLLAGAPP